MVSVANYGGAETGGGEEAHGTVGSPSIQSSVVRSGSYAVEFAAAATPARVIFVKAASSGADGDALSNGIVVGLGFRLSDKTPNTAYDFLWVDGSAGSQHIRLRLLTNGDVELRDAGNTAVATITDPFSVDTWHFVELYFERADSAPAKVWIDDIEKASVTGQDFQNGTAAASRINLQGPGLLGGTVYIDDLYILEGAADGDRYGDAEVFAYQKTDGGSAELGDALGVGTWALLSETPLDETRPGNVGEYTAAGAKAGAMRTSTGTRAGPSGDANIDGDANIKAMKGVYRLARTGGTATTHKIRMGNSGDGSANYLETVVSLTASAATYEHLSESGLVVPLAAEWCEIGMSKSAGGRDIIGGEMWAMLLHVPDAAPAGPQVGSLALTGAGR